MKRRIGTLILGIVLAATLVGCGSTGSTGQSSPASSASGTSASDRAGSSSASENSRPAADGKSIVVYFSYADNTDIDKVHSDQYDALTSASITEKGGKRYGNNTLIAQWISEETGAEVYSIHTKEKYTSDYDKVTDIGRDERDAGKDVELENGVISNLDQYQNVYLVYPIWWFELPMAVQSFLHQNDLSGKNIYPVVTSGGSGESDTLKQIREAAPDAHVSSDILEIYQDDVGSSESTVKKWADK